MLIDTHCHFDFKPFSDEITASIARFKQAGVDKIIIPAVSKLKTPRILSLINEYENLYGAVGFHPYYKHQLQEVNFLNDLLSKNNKKIVAMGEIGLDGFVDDNNLENQIQLLKAQFDLAKQFKLPVILHSRKTHVELYTLLKKENLPNKGVIHGFTGSYEQAMQFIKLGYFIGVGGTISYPRANKTRNAISQIPLDFIVLETDAPSVPLMGYQGEPNRSENLIKIFEILDSLRHEQTEQIYDAVIANSYQLFDKLNNN